MSDSKITNGVIDRVFSNVGGWSEKGKFIKPQNKNARKAELELALTVLLVDLAWSDQDFDHREYQVIVEGLHKMFGTNSIQVKSLVNQAILILKDLRGTNHYGSLLRNKLKEKQRLAIMEIVDEVIAADGKEDGFEIYIRKKISDVLGINVAEKQTPL